MRLNINLATQPYQDARQFIARWSIAVALVALLTVGLLYAAISATRSWRSFVKQEHELQRQIAERDHIRAAAESYLNLPANTATRDSSQFLNDLIARKAFSWTEVLSDLEHIMPAGIHVTSIRPEISTSGDLELRLTVAGQSRDRAIELVRKLEESRHFRNASMLSESVNKGSRDTGSLQFEIGAGYIPAYQRVPAQDQQTVASANPQGAQ